MKVIVRYLEQSSAVQRSAAQVWAIMIAGHGRHGAMAGQERPSAVSSRLSWPFPTPWAGTKASPNDQHSSSTPFRIPALLARAGCTAYLNSTDCPITLD